MVEGDLFRLRPLDADLSRARALLREQLTDVARSCGLSA
jgi:hypothetical protein